MAIKIGYLDEMGERVISYDGVCRREGCNQPIYGTSRGAWGYCCNHARLQYRNGEPYSVMEIQRRKFLDAVLAYADAPTWDNRVALCLAALNCKDRNIGADPGPDFLMMVTTRPGQKLVDACMEWADFDAEATMEEYMVARNAMYAQVECFKNRHRQVGYQGGYVTGKREQEAMQVAA